MVWASDLERKSEMIVCRISLYTYETGGGESRLRGRKTRGGHGFAWFVARVGKAM